MKKQLAIVSAFKAFVSQAKSNMLDFTKKQLEKQGYSVTKKKNK